MMVNLIIGLCLFFSTFTLAGFPKRKELLEYCQSRLEQGLINERSSVYKVSQKLRDTYPQLGTADTVALIVDHDIGLGRLLAFQPLRRSKLYEISEKGVRPTYSDSTIFLIVDDWMYKKIFSEHLVLMGSLTATATSLADRPRQTHPNAISPGQILKIANNFYAVITRENVEQKVDEKIYRFKVVQLQESPSVDSTFSGPMTELLAHQSQSRIRFRLEDVGQSVFNAGNSRFSIEMRIGKGESSQNISGQFEEVDLQKIETQSGFRILLSEYRPEYNLPKALDTRD